GPAPAPRRTTGRGALAGVVRGHLANHGIPRVICTARVDRQPANAARLDPVGELSCRAGVLDEVARLVRLQRAALGRPVRRIEAVVASVDDEDVAGLDANPGLLLPA